MARQQRTRSNSGYYHIMIRGNERKNIFHDEEDKLRFIQILHEKQQSSRFFIHAFCLMDNHVHLMLNDGIKDVSTVMKRISVSYVYYFNKKYKRVGHLFQDRFRSEIIEDDGYVLALVRYIHRNPLKAGIVRAMGEYRWSSYLCYLDENNSFRDMVDTEVVLGLFSKDNDSAKSQFIKYMNEVGLEEFIDLKEEMAQMDEKTAKKVFDEILNKWEIKHDDQAREDLPEDLIREFKKTTNLSIRKIAEITGLYKEKINKILKA